MSKNKNATFVQITILQTTLSEERTKNKLIEENFKNSQEKVSCISFLFLNAQCSVSKLASPACCQVDQLKLKISEAEQQRTELGRQLEAARAGQAEREQLHQSQVTRIILTLVLATLSALLYQLAQ